MRRTEYKFRGQVVAVVDESPVNDQVAWFRIKHAHLGLDKSERMPAYDAHALARAYLTQLKTQALTATNTEVL